MPNRRRHKNRRQEEEKYVPPLFREFKPRTQNQFDYVRAIIESDITFCTGPAGTGKSLCAIALAIQYLYDEKIEKIVITKPVVEAGPKSLGALPGNLESKMLPHVRYLHEEAESYLGKSRLANYIRDNIIEITPLEFMRGATIDNGIMILDEAQNATEKQLMLFMTRLGIGSKAIITGDTEQTDLAPQWTGGLVKCLSRLHDLEGISMVGLTEADIQRNPLIGKIINRMRDNNDNSTSTGFKSFR
jgi:phosphate starvation-inducible PhoH-like protein